MSQLNNRTIVVGVNVGHDGGAAIIIDGIIRCAVSEERINRKRYSPGYLSSFFYCLNKSGVKVEEISLIVFSSYGDQLPQHYMGDLKCLGLPSNKFITVDHHLSHAYGSYFLSPFDEALVVIIDGEGNNNTESYYVAEGQHIEKIGGNNPKRNSAKGIGRTYEAFTNFLGWIDQNAGKTMALSAYGDASNIRIPLFELIKSEVYGALEHKYEKGVFEFMRRNFIDFGPPYSKGKTTESIIAAAYVQSESENIVVSFPFM